MSRITRLILIAIVALGTLGFPVAAAASGGGFYDQGPFLDTGTESGICDAYDLEYRDKGYFWYKNTTPALNGQFFYFSQVLTQRGVYTNLANGKTLIETYTGTLHERNAKQLGDNPNHFTYESVEYGVRTIKTGRGKVIYASAGTLVRRWQFDSLGDSRPSGVRLAEPEIVKDTFKPLDFCALADKALD